MDDKIMPANARELHSIEFLAGLDCQLKGGEDTLRERLHMIPNGWRDYRLAVTRLERVLDAIYATLPTRTLLHMQRLCQCGEIVIRPKPAIRLPDDVQIVDSQDLRMLINATICAECAMCVKDAREQKSCKLRKALERIAPTAALDKDGLCAYTDVVAYNEYGKYI